MSSLGQDREQMLAAAFVELADTLVADFDVVDFLHGLADRCVGLLEVDAAGLMLADQRGSLRVVASSSEQARLVELFQLQHDQGPCLECFQTGVPVAEPELAAATGGGRRSRPPRWKPGSRRCRRCRCGCVMT